MKSATLILSIISTSLQAAITINLPGNSESATWANLRASQYPGAGGSSSFTNSTAAWPAPISGNVGSLSSAVFSKISGGGYFAGSSVYDAGTAGLYTLSDTTPLTNLASIVFQIDSGTAIGVSPVLNYNGGTQAIVADFFQASTGSYTANGPGGPVPTTNRSWQWDLSAISGITSYEVVWGSTPNNHLTQNQLNISAGDTFAQVIPEPGSITLGIVGMSFLLLRRKK